MASIVRRREEVNALRLAHSQPESLVELNELARTFRDRVTGAALHDGRVRERLAGVRHRVLAVDYREEKAATGGVIRLAEVAIYDYDRDVLVVAVVDPRAGSVVELVERESASPPITAEERDEAVRIAASQPTLAKAIRRRDAGVVAFATPSYAFDAQPERHRHRGCTLYARTGRGTVVAVTVDLTAREVVLDDLLPEVLRSPAGRTSGTRKEH